jgi:hypothetical protein
MPRGHHLELVPALQVFEADQQPQAGVLALGIAGDHGPVQGHGLGRSPLALQLAGFSELGGRVHG